MEARLRERKINRTCGYELADDPVVGDAKDGGGGEGASDGSRIGWGGSNK